jgi:hypothetical protein
MMSLSPLFLPPSPSLREGEYAGETFSSASSLREGKQRTFRIHPPHGVRGSGGELAAYSLPDSKTLPVQTAFSVASSPGLVMPLATSLVSMAPKLVMGAPALVQPMAFINVT